MSSNRASDHRDGQGLRAAARRGVTVLEVLVASVVFLVGVVAIVNYYPVSVRATIEAAQLSQAALLAQQKAEEIRRDNDLLSNLMNEIRARVTPTDPLPFPIQPILAYSFSGVSLLDPLDAPGTPRVIVRYSARYRPSQDVVFELKFQE